MEESSEKRKDRLKALRTEASNQSQSEPQSSPSSNLSNPLINTPFSFNERTSQIPRFDFYTDPMAAFSGSKRANLDSLSSPIRSPSPYVHPLNRPNATHPFGNQFQTSSSQNQSPWRSPMQFQVGHQFQTSPSPNQSSWRSPIQFQSPISDHVRGTPPNPNPNPNYWNKSGGSSPSYAFAPKYSPMGGGHPSPSFRHGGSPSPYSNSGRGNSSWFSPRPSRRGHGSYHDHGFNRHEPSHYYIKTMVKDPWRKLKPIVGNILVPRFGSGSWLPKSIATKRAKVVESGGAGAKVVESGGAKSRLSLAESLALSLEEAVDYE